jgi:hypothetical protein
MGTSVTTMLGSRSRPAFRPNELGSADEVAEQRRLHHLGDHHVDEVLGVRSTLAT